MPYRPDEAAAMLADMGETVIGPLGPVTGLLSRTWLQSTDGAGFGRQVPGFTLRVPAGALGVPARGTIVTIGGTAYRLAQRDETGDRDGAYDDWIVTEGDG